jgi:heat shock protein HtpX
MKRVILFVATNLGILVVLNIVIQLFGLDRYIGQGGTLGLLLLAAVFGMGGAFISLALSKWSAKRITGAQVIDHPRNATEVWLVNTVHQQARAAGIGVPEVALYNAPDMNAFATGMNRDNALVAVSSGLLQSMRHDEVEAVLAHEVSHVANGDMVTLSLIQGVLNTFVIFLARIIASVLDQFLRSDEEEGGGLGFFAYMGVVIVLELIFGILASIIVMWFSRQREFRADAGGARLASRGKMIAALERLRQGMEPSHLPDQLAAFGIRGRRSGLTQLFMSHPPLEERIAALKAGA